MGIGLQKFGAEQVTIFPQQQGVDPWFAFEQQAQWLLKNAAGVCAISAKVSHQAVRSGRLVTDDSGGLRVFHHGYIAGHWQPFHGQAPGPPGLQGGDPGAVASKGAGGQA